MGIIKAKQALICFERFAGKQLMSMLNKLRFDISYYR